MFTGGYGIRPYNIVTISHLNAYLPSSPHCHPRTERKRSEGSRGDKAVSYRISTHTWVPRFAFSKHEIGIIHKEKPHS